MLGSDEGDESVVRVSFETDVSDPGLAVVETIADIRGVDETELSSIYDSMDHMIDHLFSDPPTAEAQVEVRFSYEGFRITLDQNGDAEFKRI